MDPVYTDNEAADKLAKTTDGRYISIQEVSRVNLVVKGVKGKNQLADPLKKLNPMSTMTAWKATIGIGAGMQT